MKNYPGCKECSFVLVCLQFMDENKDNMINFKDFVRVLGIMCKADYTQKLKLLYMLHEPPALLDNDDFDMDVLESPTSG